MLDLHRLKTYVNERIRESRRLEVWARQNRHDDLVRAHGHSINVGLSILAEIEAEENSNINEFLNTMPTIRPGGRSL